MFGADQVLYWGFLEILLVESYFLKQPPAAAENKTVGTVKVNENSKVAAGQLNDELKL